MRVLLDECVDRRLARDLAGHEIVTVQAMGWGGTRNGQLLERAEGSFDVFLTTDQNLSFQQHLPRFTIAVVAIRARTNRLADIRPLVPNILDAIRTAERGKVTWVGKV